MSHHCNTWTQYEVDALFKLRAAGKSPLEIAERLNRTLGSISSRIRNPGRPVRAGSPRGPHEREERDVDFRKATHAHLKDILKAHGFDKAWEHVFRPGRYIRHVAVSV